MRAEPLLALAAAERHRAALALARLRPLSPGARRLAARNSRAVRGVATVAALTEEARGYRWTDPAACLSWAEVACLAAERTTGPCAADAAAEAWAERGNALRLVGEWREAALALAHAEDLVGRGSGDPLTIAEVASLCASLEIQRERPVEAARRLRSAIPLLVAAGETGRAARLLVKLAIACETGQEPEAGLDALRGAWSVLPADAPGALRLSVAHNTVLLVLQSGDPAEAVRLYDLARPLYRGYGSSIERARGWWVVGRAIGELGRSKEARVLLLEARQVLAAGHRLSEVALVALDLALVDLQADPRRAVTWVGEALPILETLGLDQSRLVALRLAAEVAEWAWLERVLRKLRRARGTPPARPLRQPSGSDAPPPSVVPPGGPSSEV